MAIGDEVIEGDTLNSNSSWIAKQCKILGHHVLFHSGCRDEPHDMHACLDFFESQGCHLIITSGGLGPTADDRTRHIIAEHFQTDLEWNESSWQRINDFFNSINMQVAQSNRHQCYFPKGSIVLANQHGTADGFYFETPKKISVLTLPGPPRELHPMWKQLCERLPAFALKQDQRRRYTLRTVGLGESTIADRIEHIEIPKDFSLGYRAHAPFVDVKLNYLKQTNNRTTVPSIIAQYKKLLAGHVFNEGETSFDALREGLRQLLITKSSPLVIQDYFSEGELAKLCYQQDHSYNKIPIEITSCFETLESSKKKRLLLDSNTWVIERDADFKYLNLSYKNHSEKLENPYINKKGKHQMLAFCWLVLKRIHTYLEQNVSN